jgi:PAS domain S-box-containing protein
MFSMRPAFLEKVLGRIEKLDEQMLRGIVEKLARDKGFLETVFNALEEGVLVVDHEGQVIYFNHAATELLGIRAPVNGLPSIKEYLDDFDWSTVEGGVPDGEMRIIRRELEVLYPRRRFLDIYITPIRLGGKEAKEALVILRDITERKHQAAEAIDSERSSAITLLAAGVAHEIGNPLNSLHIHLQLMERDLREMPASVQKKLGKSLKVAMEEVSRLDYIISQFLSAVRPVPLQLGKISVNKLLEETLEFMSSEIENRGVKVERHFAPTLPATLLDGNQVKQAFFNLIKNSLQAMSSGGRLTVRTEERADQVVVSISDTGRGIDPDKIKKIFEPFYTTKEKGTGLGLLIVERVIRQHGGWVEVNSRKNDGTSFRIFLPTSEKRTRMLEVGKSQI